MNLAVISRETAIAVAFFIAASTAQAGLRWPPPKFPDAACGALPNNYKQLAITAIKEKLRDPDSAHIHLLDAKPERGAIVANGEWVPGIDVRARVNAKNGFGGYTGDHLFLVSFYRGNVVNVVDVSAHY